MARLFFNIWPLTTMKTNSTAALVFCQCEFEMLQNIKASFLNLPETFKFCQSGDFLPNLVTLILARKLIEIATLPNDKKSTHLIRKTVLKQDIYIRSASRYCRVTYRGPIQLCIVSSRSQCLKQIDKAL